MSSQPGGTNVTTRKKRRGMIEKRRRDKINNSLCELRRLVPAAFEKQGSAKLEKAEILQMTVDYLRMLHARGLADSLTTNKHLSTTAPLTSINNDTAPFGSQSDTQISSPKQASHTQLAPQHAQNTTDNLMSHTDQTVQLHSSPISSGHQQQPVPPVTPHIQHSNSLAHHNHQALTSTPTNTAAANPSPSIHHSPSMAHHHLYNQHHMSVAAAEHAAAAYHQLSANSLGSADMTGMMPHPGSHQAAQYHHHQQQHHHQPHHHHQLKMEQSQLVVPHSHPSLLNLDHHHHHHQAHHSHNHPLTAHYGSHHHHHHQSGASLAMNPYLAATAAAAVAYPSMSAVSAAAVSTQLPSTATAASMDPLHCQSAVFEQQQLLNSSNSSSGSNTSQVQQHLTQLPSDCAGVGAGGSSSPAANDANSQQVSSSSSPSDSTSNTSTAAAQRHYRPWGTELAY